MTSRTQKMMALVEVGHKSAAMWRAIPKFLMCLQVVGSISSEMSEISETGSMMQASHP